MLNGGKVRLARPICVPLSCRNAEGLSSLGVFLNVFLNGKAARMPPFVCYFFTCKLFKSDSFTPLNQSRLAEIPRTLARPPSHLAPKGHSHWDYSFTSDR